MTRNPAPDAPFREDINGLRAWSVVAVIGYHFKVPGFSGGFIGVDTFFVISGFLMTGIVVKALEKGSFSLFGFYLARARRIVPALAAVCAVLLLLGWWVLMPPDYRALATHVVASMAFFSNIRFWDEAGYFDAASHEKWLLHTWSLSVEWQFYLLLPALLWLMWAWRPTRKALAGALLACFIASFLACLLATAREPSAAFYLLHYRAWELLGGGLVFLFAGNAVIAAPTRRAAQLLGLGLIAACVIGLDSQTAWPGWHALIPVAGAMLVIAAAHRSAWTRHRVIGWLGLRSYSLYLWHWPIVVALAYADLHLETWGVMSGILLTAAIAELSYRFVETPARVRLGRVGAWFNVAAFGVTVGALCLVGVAVWGLKGVSGRFTPAIELAAAEANNINPLREACYQRQGVASPSCIYGGKEWKVIGLGDSHLSALITGVAAGHPNGAGGVVQWSYRGCLFVPGLKSVRAATDEAYRCAEFIEWALSQLETLPGSIPVVVIGRYAHAAMGPNELRTATNVPEVYFSKVHATSNVEFLAEFSEAITKTACTLAKNRTVFLVRPIPEMGFDVPKTLSRRMVWGKTEDLSISLQDYQARNAWVWAAQDAARDRCGARILDPLPYLCRDGRCYGSKDGRPLYVDDDHLSEFGNKQLAPMFSEVFRGLP